MFKIIFLTLALMLLYGMSMQELIDLGLNQSPLIKQSRNQQEQLPISQKGSKQYKTDFTA